MSRARSIIEPSTAPGWWHVRQITGVGDDSASQLAKDEAGRVRLFASAATAATWVDAQVSR